MCFANFWFRVVLQSCVWDDCNSESASSMVIDGIGASSSSFSWSSTIITWVKSIRNPTVIKGNILLFVNASHMPRVSATGYWNAESYANAQCTQKLLPAFQTSSRNPAASALLSFPTIINPRLHHLVTHSLLLPLPSLRPHILPAIPGQLAPITLPPHRSRHSFPLPWLPRTDKRLPSHSPDPPEWNLTQKGWIKYCTSTTAPVSEIPSHFLSTTAPPNLCLFLT